MFNRVIVRTPCREISKGLSAANLGPPIYEKALAQHTQYVKALQSCGLEIIILDADDNYPDSTFIEDTALLTPQCAIITNPGAISRRGEVHAVYRILKDYYEIIEWIKEPGTVDAGDIMTVGSHYFIGLSRRTNTHGASRVIGILKKYGMTGTIIPLKNVLHLKSGVAYLENNIMVASGEFIEKKELQRYKILKIDNDESYAANCVWINGTVLVAKGFPKARKAIESCGYSTIEVDVSEFRKLDGGLSCLSLRFSTLKV
jgi:dimethylargininase